MRQFNPVIERVRVQSLKPFPRNARRHSKAQIKQIAASIERLRFQQSSAHRRRRRHRRRPRERVAAAKLLGIEFVPVVRLSHLTEVEKRAYVIADNKLA